MNSLAIKCQNVIAIMSIKTNTSVMKKCLCCFSLKSNSPKANSHSFVVKQKRDEEISQNI